MGHTRINYMQLAPILNKIDTILSFILEGLDKMSDSEFPLKPDISEEFYNVFLRSCNLFHVFVNELSPVDRGRNEIDKMHTSYLDHLVGFLRYTQEPLYVLRVAALISEFVRKFGRLTEEENIKVFVEFLNFSTPFLRLLDSHGFKIDAFLEFLSKQATPEFNISEWKDFTGNLSQKITSEESLKSLLDTRKETLRAAFVTLAKEDRNTALALSGEFFLISLLKDNSEKKNSIFEINALAISSLLLYGISLPFSSFVNM